MREYHYPADIVEDIPSLEGVSVAIINMPIREQALPNNPPLGPALIAARLRDKGADASIIDLNAYRDNGRFLSLKEVEDMLSREFNKTTPHLIGLSGLITTLKWQKEVATMVRKNWPEALLVSGGGLATEFRDILLKWIPELDGIAHSEGDDVILKIAYDAKLIRDKGTKKAVESGKLAPYFTGMNGDRARFHYDGGRPKDLDALPYPAWDLLDPSVLEMYITNPIWGEAAKNSSAAPFTMERSLATVSARGCPFACKFCFRGGQGERNYGIRSAESLTGEVVWAHDKYKIDFIGILDDNFMVRPKRIERLVEFMEPVVAETGVHWGTHGRLDEAADLKPTLNRSVSAFNKRLRVDDMHRSGCVYIGFGAESANVNTLDRMGKGGFILRNGNVNINGHTFPRTMVEGIRNTKNSGIHANCTWIMGYPGETLKELKTTIGFIQWQEEFYSQFGDMETVNKSLFIATAYPGTEMFKDPIVKEKLGRLLDVKFDAEGNPIPDAAFENYVLELNDATKVIYDDDGTPLNYGAMTSEQFLEVREHVDNGQIENILDM